MKRANGYTIDKTNTPHIVPLARQVMDVLKELHSYTGHGEWVFPSIHQKGERYDLIEHQLAHMVRDPNGRAYNRTVHLVERKRMMERWATYLDELRADVAVVA